jgi:hypothetical protein
VPFALQMNPGSYIDISSGSSTTCGYVPQICLEDFKQNGVERDSDDFYQKLVTLVDGNSITTRIAPANDLIDGGLHFYLGTPTELGGESPDGIVVGCAKLIRTKHQTIYQVETTVK